MVFSDAHVLTRMVAGAPLANNDISAACRLAPKNFYPSRLLSDSLPFLELPTPFLCAMDKNQIELTYRLNTEFGELLAMTIHFMVSLAALLFENKNFIALNL